LKKIDQQDEAIHFYQLAIEEIFNGLQVKLDSDQREGLEYGLRIQEMLHSDLMKALERVEILSKLLDIF
jgi:hypothetical protein